MLQPFCCVLGIDWNYSLGPFHNVFQNSTQINTETCKSTKMWMGEKLVTVKTFHKKQYMYLCLYDYSTINRRAQCRLLKMLLCMLISLMQQDVLVKNWMSIYACPLHASVCIWLRGLHDFNMTSVTLMIKQETHSLTSACVSTLYSV